MFCDPAEFLRHVRKIDDLDCIERRRLLEFVVNGCEHDARDRGRSFYANVDIRALASHAGRTRSEQEDVIGRIRHMPPDHGSRKFGGIGRVADRSHAAVYLIRKT
jgi:hypothetical protein